MSGFVLITTGCVAIEHYSTASLIKITIAQGVEKDQSGATETVNNEIWLEYNEFKDLALAIKRVTQI